MAAAPARALAGGALLALALTLAPRTTGRAAYGQSWDLEARRLAGLKAEVAALIVGGDEGGSLPAAVLALPTPPTTAEGNAAVPFVVELDGASLANGGDATRQVEIYAYALDGGGAVRDFLTQGFDLDLAHRGESIYERGVKFAGHLELPPGRYSLRVLALEPKSKAYALRVLPLDVPARGDPAASPPLFPDPPSGWLLVREAARPAGEDGSPARDPERGLRALAAATLPAALPVLPRSGGVELQLLATDLGEAPTVTAELTPETAGDRRPSRGEKIRLEALGGAPTGIDGTERMRFRLDLPELADGRYELRLGVSGRRGASPAPLSVLVWGGAKAGAPVSWSQLRAAVQAPQVAETKSGVEIQLPKHRRKRASAIEAHTREAYDAALRLLGKGTPVSQAAAHLAQVETALVEQAPDQAIGILRDTELELAVELGRANAESLVPLFVLHTELYRRYRAERQFQLATHSRTLAATVAEIYAKLAATEDAKVVASRALTSLGAYLQEADLWGHSRALLEKALELDPNNEAALLHLGVSFEKTGEYAEAVPPLEKLVELDSKNPAGRLRLAINLGRTGHAGREAAVLRQLVAEENPPWVLTIAYEELARLLAAGDRLDEAAALLGRAVDRLPHQPRLLIQLAYVLDRERQPVAARRVVGRLSAQPRGGPDSPRHLYNRWPSEELTQTRRSLDQGSLIRLSALAGALDQVAAAEKGR